MSESKHTATPWAVDAVTSEHLHDIVMVNPPAGWGNPVVVATTGDDDGPLGITPREAEANARLIVRAVNSHEELLAACEAALPWLHAEATTAHDCRMEFVPECRLCCVRRQVADAIARGKGG